MTRVAAAGEQLADGIHSVVQLGQQALAVACAAVVVAATMQVFGSPPVIPLPFPTTTLVTFPVRP